MIDFSGSAATVSFIAPAPQSAQSQGRARITLSGERDGGHVALVMRARPELAAGNVGGWSEPLLRNLAAVRFSYFGVAAPGTAPAWRTVWPSGKTFPQLVRIHVDFAKGDGRVWPDLVVAPHIEVDSACLYDYTTKYCQGRR